MVDNDWTSVPRGRKSRKPQPVAGIPAPSRLLTVEDITREFDAKSKQWHKTECRKQLIRQIDWAVGSRENGAAIERYICIGSGSLSRDNIECRRRSMWQIVVFLDMVSHLVDTSEPRPEDLRKTTEDCSRVTRGIWASDPAYTALDAAFLSRKGVEVLPVDKTDPGLGSLRHHVRGQALLYEPFVDMDAHMVRDMIEDNVSLYIGSSIGGLKERQGEVGELAQMFCTGRSLRKFPEFEIDPNIFDGMRIYWKEESDD